jgi:penicillin-binding protein 1C
MLIASEDRRFELHAGVDVRSVARAAWTNLRAGRVISGASTLTMQLARMLEQSELETAPFNASALGHRADDPPTPSATSTAKHRTRPSRTLANGADPRGVTTHAPANDADPLGEPCESATTEAAARATTAAVGRTEARSRASAHSWLTKLSRAWTALALEQRLSKAEILEAYVNLAYYGAGAYGIEAAARTYFGKSVAALSDAESSLLAVLPRAPATYDPRRKLDRARKRRDRVLAMLTERGELDPVSDLAVRNSPITIAPPVAAPPGAAGHFVDYALATLPASARRSGGTLHTTLDLNLQTTLEQIVAEHVASLGDRGVDQAGVVVLDTDTGAIRAMVGSRAYGSSQINITTRRRQLGSLLKPFVYALAIEAGESPASVALDVGDTSPDYRARDWVGREAGPLSYKEALAGSYNLAAIHVLERVGVPALHARLRKAGVAALDSAPARYGLMLALGSARVRLLDVASGYGFLVRGGSCRAAHAIDSLERGDGSSWRPVSASDRALFSESVSWQVMDMLSDAAARHRRFGLGLPLEAAGAVAAKTGTASGLSDLSAILASREYTVAAWVGRFDGQPTHGASGMWAAAPLASRALIAALGGRLATLPPRPTELATASSDTRTSATHSELPPPELEPWAERARALAGRKRATEAR